MPAGLTAATEDSSPPSMYHALLVRVDPQLNPQGIPLPLLVPRGEACCQQSQNLLALFDLLHKASGEIGREA